MSGGGSRHRARVLAVVAGIFVVMVGGAWVLLRVSRSSVPEAVGAPSPAAVVTSAPSQDHGGDSGGGGEPTRTAADDAGDDAGAVRAALTYASAPQEWLYMSDDEIRSAVAAVATPDASGRLGTEAVEEIASARTELSTAAGPIWWIVHPLAWKVDSSGPGEATVSVWTFSFLSAADVAVPQTEWATVTFDLERSQDQDQGGWRLAAVRDSVGPTPAVGPADQPWEPEPLDDALDGFTRLTWDGNS